MNTVSMKNKKIVPTSLIALAMLYTIFLLLCYMFSRKEFYFPFHALSAAGMLVAPVALILMDVIVEVFGYRIGKQVFWSSIIVQAVFCFVAAFLAFLPEPDLMQGAISAQAYHSVMGVLPRIFLSSLIAMMLGVWVNARLIAKWKFLLNGRYFWLRSVGASGIGDGIFVTLSTFLANVGTFPLHPLLRALLNNYIIELVAIIILSPFAAMLVRILKHLTKDFLAANPSVEYNPFVKEEK